MRNIAVHPNALPDPLFTELARAAHEVGNERLGDGYATNFWFALEASPRNLVEEAIVVLRRLARPGPRCIGAEWWLGRLRQGESLDLHFDRDLALERLEGRIVHPLRSSVLYLNSFPSSPTVVLEQVLGRDGRSLVPPCAKSGKSVRPAPNHYLVYPGNLLHGVVAQRAARRTGGLRLTLLVNYWDQRPLAPICRDYDGSVYAALGRMLPRAA